MSEREREKERENEVTSHPLTSNANGKKSPRRGVEWENPLETQREYIEIEMGYAYG